ncbi:MAG: BLUF domain-containing protein [Burkholderiaceae bacterium]|nr:BLUF domain-containing protein [Burkholderiaceae bacterium]MDZ4144534.1 BLUF domain-containing protein [Burkholderiales bacterium]
MACLLYCSVAAWKPRPTHWRDMLRSAAAFNQGHGVSSVLMHGEGRYVQWIEGPQGALGPLWSRIRKDARHAQLTVLHKGPRPEAAIHLHASRPMVVLGPMGLVELVHLVRDLYLNAQFERGVAERATAADAVARVLALRVQG